MIKEKETIEREAARNYNLYKKSKEENEKLQKLVKDLKNEQKDLSTKVLKLKDYETKFKKASNENKDLKQKFEKIMKEEFKRLQEENKNRVFDMEGDNNGKGDTLEQKMDLDQYGLNSDDFRSERNKKYTRGIH